MREGGRREQQADEERGNGALKQDRAPVKARLYPPSGGRMQMLHFSRC
jgi:hypothetical protein